MCHSARARARVCVCVYGMNLRYTLRWHIHVSVHSVLYTSTRILKPFEKSELTGIKELSLSPQHRSQLCFSDHTSSLRSRPPLNFSQIQTSVHSFPHARTERGSSSSPRRLLCILRIHRFILDKVCHFICRHDLTNTGR